MRASRARAKYLVTKNPRAIQISYSDSRKGGWAIATQIGNQLVPMTYLYATVSKAWAEYRDRVATEEAL